MAHHPIAERFRPFSGPVAAGYDVDSLGVFYDVQMFDPTAERPPARDCERQILEFSGEGYFDWIELLQAVDTASGSFTMVELGAGYGYWSMEAALAARQRDLASRLVAIEAEPIHYEMMLRHLRDNGVDPDAHDVRCAAVAPQDGTVLFETGNSLGWWGQAIVDSADPRANDGREIRSVPAVSLTSLLAPLDRVNVLHMDVQGVELDVLTAAFDVVTAKVDRIIIGTHSPAIEAGLRQLFGEWTPVCDYRMGEANATPFGDTTFGDGLQIWRNPRPRL
jgi:FkbM family methyltransferase